MDAATLEKMKLAMEQLNKKRIAAVNGLREMTKNPMQVQTEFLLKLLEDNRDTEYGKKYGFSEIKSIADFQKKVPITTYDDYAPYIERMAEKGERNLITAYPLHIYNKTSGTVGSPKKIPMTVPAADMFQKYASDYLSGFLNDRLGSNATAGRTVSVVQATDTKTMPDGVEFGALSDYYMKKAIPAWDRLFTAPPEAAFASSGTNIRYIHARYSLCAEDAVGISCSFTSFASEFLRYIEHNWEMLVRDIEAGTIDDSIEMPVEVREALLTKTVPMPERAAKLREIFSRGFDEPFVPKVWPRVRYFSGACTGSFKTYADLICRRYLGKDIALYSRGVCASEGAFSVPVEFNSHDSVLLPDSVFFEFAPEKDGEADLGDIKTLDALEVGKRYELIVTNLSGYYRYRMRDVFLVKGMYNKTPLIEFQYRSDKTVSIMGEKTTEIALKETAVKAAEACGFTLIDSTMYPDYENTRYIFLLEIENVPPSLTEENVRDALEASLAQANPSMGDKIKKGLCKPTQVKFMQSEAFLLWRDIAVLRGASPGQQKPVTVISNETQRKFFFGQTEAFERVRELFPAR